MNYDSTVLSSPNQEVYMSIEPTGSGSVLGKRSSLVESPAPFSKELKITQNAALVAPIAERPAASGFLGKRVLSPVNNYLSSKKSKTGPQLNDLLQRVRSRTPTASPPATLAKRSAWVVGNST